MLRSLFFLGLCLFTTPICAYDEEAKEEFTLSTPEQIAALTCEPNYLVGGLISPLSGQPVLREIDLVAKGAQNVILSRIYIPPYMPCTFQKYESNQREWDKRSLYHYVADHYKGWQFYPHLKLLFNAVSKEVLLTDPHGMSLNFQLSKANCYLSSSYAISNTAGDIPHGKYDPRNTRLVLAEDGSKITVHSPNGSTRCYHKWQATSQTEQLFLLHKEILPNGKVLKYHYSITGQPAYVESLDPKEQFVYASISIQGSPWDGHCHFTSSTGSTVDYAYQKRPLSVKIKEKANIRSTDKIKHGKMKIELNFLCPPILTSVSSPFYRHESLEYASNFLLNSYIGKNHVFTTNNAGYGKGIQHYRVHQLLLPAHKNDALEPVYTLNYHPPIAGEQEGSTTVNNSDGTSTVYHFSKNLLTTLIQYFGQEGTLKKEKVYSWDENNWLKVLKIRDSQQNSLYETSYDYDAFGNPILEVLTGDLTGSGAQETFTTKRIFSEDGRNLLLKEEREDGKATCFTYLPHTNLITSKLTKDRDQILLREFSIYDDNNNLIQKISDNGSSEVQDCLIGATQRTLTTYILRQTPPFLHMPEWIEESYLEAETEKLLKKSHLFYDLHGNVAQEKVYDADGRHRFTLYKTYNERGDILTETNRIAQEAVYTYGPKGDLATSTTFSQRIKKTLLYDAKGLCREQIEEADDGCVHTNSFEYDPHDRLIRKTDLFHNTTNYAYDPLVSKIVKTDFPPIESIDGNALQVMAHSEYDPFGREIKKIDANGNCTTYQYNAYGSPNEILHPNGGKESFLYEKNGQLAKATTLDGLTILYKHDVLGHILSKTYQNPDGNIIAHELFTYNGFNLLSETDKEGHVRTYSYDGAGRKIRDEFCGQVTDLCYDSLGRLSTICKHNGNNALIIQYERNLEGRILETKKTDVLGNLLYKIQHSYDSNGNLASTTKFIHDQEAITTFVYDSFGRLTEETDAEGHVTKTLYNEHCENSLGQRVLQKITTDPLNITAIETKDALARTVKTETLNPQGIPIACKQLYHDPHGNLLIQRDHIYEKDLFQKTQTLRFNYTSDHRVKNQTRAYQTEDARTTSFTYYPSGKIASKTLPDAITLSYSYDPLGYLHRLESTDGNIKHSFTFNRLGHLLHAIDENNNVSIGRTVDPHGNILQEDFPNALNIIKEYDAFNRLTALKIGNLGEVHYTYDPLFLRNVARVSPEGEMLYEHSYEAYDTNGNLHLERLIANLGRVVHLTGPKGQKTSVSSPFFTEEYTYDPVGNLTIKRTDSTEHDYSYDDLSQLLSESSTSYSLTYDYNSLFNRAAKNSKIQKVNSLNELLIRGITYDLNGNQLLKRTAAETFRLTYDPLNQLTQAISEKQKINFIYDPLGRRLSKIVSTPTGYGWKEASRENYIYHGAHEIGALDPNSSPKNLRHLGLNDTTIAVELEGHPFAPQVDLQGNIRRLIDLKTRSETNRYEFSAFGEELQSDRHPHAINPWRYVSKRIDPDLGLIYFGKRDYDPLLGRWLTIDPAGFIDSANLYQYVFNNPYRYQDPDGRFIIALPLLALSWKLVAVAVATAYVAYELEHQHKHFSSSFARSFNSAAHQVVQTIGGGSLHLLNQKLHNGKIQRHKQGRIDQNSKNPGELENNPDWKEVTHPNQAKSGHREFENIKTGEKLRFDKGEPGKPGHSGHDHHHHLKPDPKTGEYNYVDEAGNTVPRGSDASHLYSPQNAWWN